MQKKKYTFPSMEYAFDIQIKGEESQIVWAGKFMFRRPTLRERAAIAALEARLNMDLTTIDPDARALNEALATLRFTLKDYPDWWKDTSYGDDLYDANVVIEIYNKCMEFEANWRKKVLGGDEKDVEMSDETEDTGVPATT